MEEIDLKELIDMFLRKKFLIIFVIILSAALGVIYTLKFVVPKYQSETSLILVQQSAAEMLKDSNTESITTADLTLNSKLVANYREVCTSKSVVNKVIDNLNLNYTYEELKSNISVSTKSDTEVITIIVQNEDNKLACKIANELAVVFIERVEEIYKTKNIQVLDIANVNNTPCNINLSKNVVVFAFVGAILVFAYILLINILDTTIKSDVDIEKITGLPVLATIVLNDDSAKNSSKSKKSSSSKSSRKSEHLEEDSSSRNETISMFSYLNNDYVDDDDKN